MNRDEVTKTINIQGIQIPFLCNINVDIHVSALLKCNGNDNIFLITVSTWNHTVWSQLIRTLLSHGGLGSLKGPKSELS